MRSILLFLITLTTYYKSFGQNSLEQLRRMQSTPQYYTVLKTKSNINIDGKDDEKAWKDASWTNSFVDIEGLQKSKPLYDTKVKMLWDDTYLYIYAKLEEPHVWADITKHDAIIYHNNDFEIFIKPYENQNHYFEIEVNPLNTILDLVMIKPYRFGGEAMLHWDAKGLKSAIDIKGSINNPNDEDKYWTVEMAIPFEAIQSFGRSSTPKIGEYWSINFSRVQWQHQIKNGKYSRSHKDNQLVQEDNWVWSPIGLINMHYPERWGYIQFIDSSTKYETNLPRSHNIKMLTWNIFYLQQLYKQKHKKYCHDIPTLLQEIEAMESDRYKYEITMNKDSTQYQLDVEDLKQGIKTSIDNKGNYSIRYDK